MTALAVEPRAKKSVYPAVFAQRVQGREKRQLGEVFGIKKFGVNLTILSPGAQSALLHRHSKQEEFVYVLKGEAILVTDKGEHVIRAGDCAGFGAGGVAHMLVNRSAADVHYLEVGDRENGDDVEYPQDDLKATMTPQGWAFTHKNGDSY